MEKVLLDVELRSGMVQGLATHQPNPHLVTLLAKQLSLPAEKFPAVANTFGNLGSSTCGVALATILQSSNGGQPTKLGPVFLASLGPGLLFGGDWLIHD
jgi:3-oxoacyl-[acyl-carrier-protein] synthase III